MQPSRTPSFSHFSHHQDPEKEINTKEKMVRVYLQTVSNFGHVPKQCDGRLFRGLYHTHRRERVNRFLCLTTGLSHTNSTWFYPTCDAKHNTLPPLTLRAGKIVPFIISPCLSFPPLAEKHIQCLANDQTLPYSLILQPWKTQKSGKNPDTS